MRNQTASLPAVGPYLIELLVAVLLATNALGQGAGAAYWYDVPSAPLKFDIPLRDHRYSEMQMLKIRSTGGVVTAYELGCIRLDNGVMVSTETIRGWRRAPGRSVLSHTYPRDHRHCLCEAIRATCGREGAIRRWSGVADTEGGSTGRNEAVTARPKRAQGGRETSRLLFSDRFLLDDHLQVRGHVLVQLHRDRELAHGLQRLVQLDFAAIHVEALLG